MSQKKATKKQPSAKSIEHNTPAPDMTLGDYGFNMVIEIVKAMPEREA